MEFQDATEQSTHRHDDLAARAGAADRVGANHRVLGALTKLRTGAALDVGDRQDLLREHLGMLEQVAALESHLCPVTDITALAQEIITWRRRELPSTDAATQELLSGVNYPALKGRAWRIARPSFLFR